MGFGGRFNMSSSLVELYSQSTVNNVSQFSKFATQLDVVELIRNYKDLVLSAPHRHETGLKYFVEGHEVFIGRENSPRKEEHLAGALFNKCKEGDTFNFPNGGELDIIDYQFPLSSKKKDKGIGKIDLFGVIDKHTPCVIELKVMGKNGRKPDTPLRAFLEGLAYCAIVESNISAIAKEAQDRFNLKFKLPRPHLIVIAPEDYWSYYLEKKAAGDWTTPLKTLTKKVCQQLKLEVHFVSIKNAEFHWGGNGEPATMKSNCKFVTVKELIAN
jgi:hypothetical protein